MTPFFKKLLTILPIYFMVGSSYAEEGEAGEAETKFTMENHGERAKKLSYDQDDLSADVQDLIDEQTDTKIIELLRQTEIIMGDATDLLEDKDTGGATIATQTEIIEKIFEAAKQKQQSSGEGEDEAEGKKKSMSSMLQMMENMMDGGKDKGEGKEPGEGKEGQGDGGGGGGKGGSGNGGEAGAADNTAENAERRVPKSSGNTNSSLPKEFQKAMDAYNQGAKEQP